MGDMIYLAAGYGVIWLVAFGFIYSLVSRQRNLQRDVEMLKQLTDQHQD